WKGFPFPLDAFRKHRPGNILDALHYLDQPVPALCFDWCEPYAAITHDGRSDPMPGGRAQVGVPGCLPVVVGMDVDPARRHQATCGVYDPARRPRFSTGLFNSAVADGDVSGVGGFTTSIDYRPAAYHKVMHV